MKVGFVAPLGIVLVNGGVRTQALQTASALNKLGVEVEFISPWQEGIEVDLVHIFVAGPDTIGIISRCLELGIKTLLSPVFFSNRSAASISFSLKAEKVLSKIGSGIRSDFGIKAEACSIADFILPNTNAEAELIEKGFGISPSRIEVIPNGVELRFANATPDLFELNYGLKDFVLFVGQAGARRKNVIKLLESAQDIEAPIVIIGSLFDDEYGERCKQLGRKAGNVTFIDTLDHNSDLLSSAYASCHTFVLPSLYETPGIAAMEAALAGANIAITEIGGTKDYFGEWTDYLNPKSSESIAKAVNNALSKEKVESLKNHILENYSWDVVGEKTLKAYNKL